MHDGKPTTITVSFHEAGTWDALREEVRQEAGWAADAAVTAYVESVNECFLRAVRLDAFAPPEDAWEGRLFGGDAEVRWVAHEAPPSPAVETPGGDSPSAAHDPAQSPAAGEIPVPPASRRFKAWVTHEGDTGYEAPAGNMERHEVLALPRFYYLMGEYECPGGAARTAVFTEGRYPDKDFEYPLPGDCSPQPHDRAFILVREYYRQPPEWSQFSNPGEIENQLDQPMLVAHRFVCVGAGRGG